MTTRYAVAGTLMAIVLTLLSSVAVAQSRNTVRAPGSCPLLTESCNGMCASNRDCSLPPDSRSCGHDISLPFNGHIHVNDPTCEAAKAAQNAAYANQRATCELVKAAERSECEVRKSGCLAVAKACGDVREKATASSIAGARILWVDNHPDKNTYERQALTELKVMIILASNTEEALSTIQHQTPRINATISSLSRPEGPLAGYSLLAAILKLPDPPPYIIYSTSSNATIVAEAKAKGAFGETDRVTELFDLIISAVSRHK